MYLKSKKFQLAFSSRLEMAHQKLERGGGFWSLPPLPKIGLRKNFALNFLTTAILLELTNNVNCVKCSTKKKNGEGSVKMID